jgi:two-component system, NtrC family, response regulator AtoC
VGSLGILVVDDEPTILTSCRRVLERAGHQVQAVDTPSSALDLCSRQRFDVILTDILMPGMSGLELIDHLKATAPAVRIVVMTGFGSREVAADALQRGASGLLVKPFTPAELREVVASAAS